MTLLKIASLGHPVLRQSARRLAVDELLGPGVQRLIDDMIETMRDANGAGLAALQIYESAHICVLEVNHNPRYPYKPPIPLTVLVNGELEILSRDDERFSNYEGCLSVPNLRGRVWRHPRVRVHGLNRRGEPIEFEARGLTAGTFQHELDHLAGVIFVDRVTDPTSFCTWEHFERYYKEGFAQEAAAVTARWGS